MAWIGNYFRIKTAKFRVQDPLPQHMPLGNGVQKGGLLSPVLFNDLMSCILNVCLPEGHKIISFAVDHTVISTDRKILRKAQHCLDPVSEKCCRTGLKMNKITNSANWLSHTSRVLIYYHLKK